MSLMPSERRKHGRRPGQQEYLRIGGHDARLVDWSFGGIGAELDTPGALVPGTDTAVSIRDRETDTWVDVPGIVRWIDGPWIGIEFLPDAPNLSQSLLKLLRHRLMENQADVAKNDG